MGVGEQQTAELATCLLHVEPGEAQRFLSTCCIPDIVLGDRHTLSLWDLGCGKGGIKTKPSELCGELEGMTGKNENRIKGSKEWMRMIQI